MRVDFLLEEESAAAMLRALLPRLLPGSTWQLKTFEGCRDLLGQLPHLLPAYRRRMAQPGQEDLRLVVLLDADSVGPRRLAELEQYAATAGLLSYATVPAGVPFFILNCLAVQELEAWFLGDPLAIQTAYPRVHANHFKGISTNPDVIPDAWETLWRTLQRANLYLTSKPKTEWAATIAPHLDPTRNASASFRYFCAALAALR